MKLITKKVRDKWFSQLIRFAYPFLGYIRQYKQILVIRYWAIRKDSFSRETTQKKKNNNHPGRRSGAIKSKIIPRIGVCVGPHWLWHESYPWKKSGKGSSQSRKIKCNRLLDTYTARCVVLVYSPHCPFFHLLFRRNTCTDTQTTTSR